MAVPHRGNGDGNNQGFRLLDENEAQELEMELEDEEQSAAPVSPEIRAIIQAAEVGDVEALILAIENSNGRLDQPLEDGDTALHLCCLYGHKACVQVLLEKGAKVDSKDEDGSLPLHDACAGGFVDIVSILLSASENQARVKRMLETQDDDGDTPLHNAARGEHLELVQLLLSRGASPNIINSMGKKPGDLPDSDTEVWRFLNGVNTL